MLEDAHQPQLPRPVQAAQSAELLHESVEQSEVVHCQPVQLPVPGPLDVPVEHSPVDGQKPQPDMGVQLAQSVLDRHGSEEPQEEEYQLQSEQLPELGPELVPD